MWFLFWRTEQCLCPQELLFVYWVFISEWTGGCKFLKVTEWRITYGSRNKKCIRFVKFFETSSVCCVYARFSVESFFSAPSLYVSYASYLQKFPGIRRLLYRKFCLPVYCSLRVYLWRLRTQKWTSTSFFGLGCDQKKIPQKWRTNIRFLLHDNAPARRSVFAMDFLAKNNVTTLQHPWPGCSWFFPVTSTEIGIEKTALLWCYWHP